MADQLNVHESKTQFSHLLACVEAGEEIVIARHGRPVARLVPEQRLRRATRRPGGLEGRSEILGDRDESDKEIAEGIVGREFDAARHG